MRENEKYVSGIDVHVASESFNNIICPFDSIKMYVSPELATMFVTEVLQREIRETSSYDVETQDFEYIEQLARASKQILEAIEKIRPNTESENPATEKATGPWEE